MPESPQFIFSSASSLDQYIQPKPKSCKFFLYKFLKKQPLISTHRDTTLIHVLNISLHHDYTISDLWSLSFTLCDAAKITSILRLLSSLRITHACFPDPVATLLNIPLPTSRHYPALTSILRSSVLNNEAHLEAFKLKPLLNFFFYNNAYTTVTADVLWSVMEIKGISPASCASCQKTTCGKAQGPPLVAQLGITQ